MANFPTQIVTIVFQIDLWEYFPNKTVTYYRSDSQPYFETVEIIIDLKV